MRILVVGDVVGKTGLHMLEEKLPILRKNENIDFVITNAENIADGMGITEKDYKQLLNLKVDALTMGNHTWGKKDIFKIINEPNILRPCNYANNVPGKGYRIFTCKNKKIAVINAMGRAEINILTDNPFLAIDRIIQKISSEVDIIVVDFHAEATAEKKAMGYYLDGRVCAIFGTHTHIQTADEQILPNGTAYITDIGMTGPKDSIIGMDIEASLKRFVTSLPERYKIAEGDGMFNGIILDINEDKCRVEKISRINE